MVRNHERIDVEGASVALQLRVAVCRAWYDEKLLNEERRTVMGP